MNEEKVPLLAVFAAGVFVLQVFNLPVTMGTSGHLVGGALVAIVLGSSARRTRRSSSSRSF